MWTNKHLPLPAEFYRSRKKLRDKCHLSATDPGLCQAVPDTEPQGWRPLPGAGRAGQGAGVLFPWRGGADRVQPTDLPRAAGPAQDMAVPTRLSSHTHVSDEVTALGRRKAELSSQKGSSPVGKTSPLPPQQEEEGPVNSGQVHGPLRLASPHAEGTQHRATRSIRSAPCLSPAYEHLLCACHNSGWESGGGSPGQPWQSPSCKSQVGGLGRRLRGRAPSVHPLLRGPF